MLSTELFNVLIHIPNGTYLLTNISESLKTLSFKAINVKKLGWRGS